MKIVLSKQFERKVAKLPLSLKKALALRIRMFMSDSFSPILNNHALKGSQRSYRSINITGDYRLIFEQYDDTIVRFIDIDTHHNLYGS